MTDNGYERHLNGWVQIKVPLPFSLKWMNAYLLPDGGSWTIVDPGLRTADTEAYWQETLRGLGIAWTDISAIVVTHHHPDHYGLAGWFQERTGASVLLSDTARSYARLMWGEGETFSERLVAAFQSHGLPDELRDGMRGHLQNVRDQVLPHPQDTNTVAAGDRITFGGTEWRVFGGEGHAQGHLLFYDEASRTILCGDQVLPDISPNIGWLPVGEPDPLGAYLSSLRELQPLEVRMAYPGHRGPIADFAGRIQELLDHHDRRLGKMADILAEEAPLSAFEMCEKLFGTRLRGSPHNLRFALAETVAHLVRLELSGLAERTAGGEPNRIRFAPAGS